MFEMPTHADFVLPPPQQASVAVHNAKARFPVRRIICVGRNYAAHAREMGRDPDREPPFFFMKPADTASTMEGRFRIRRRRRTFTTKSS